MSDVHVAQQTRIDNASSWFPRRLRAPLLTNIPLHCEQTLAPFATAFTARLVAATREERPPSEASILLEPARGRPRTRLILIMHGNYQ